MHREKSGRAARLVRRGAAVALSLVAGLGLASSGLVEPAARTPQEADEPNPTGRADEAVFTSSRLVIERGPGRVPLIVPRDELLHFDVTVDLGPLGRTKAGTVDLSAGITPYRPALPTPGQPRSEARGQVGWVKSRARGGHLGYKLDHTLRARHLPQAYPSLFYLDLQKGSENRRRELRFGVRDGRECVVVRRDGHCKGCESEDHQVRGLLPWDDLEHCRRCKRSEHRVWRPSAQRDVPEGAIDMLSAVYLARGFVESGEDRIEFPIVDRKHTWIVELSRGELRTIHTGAGPFDCVAIQLATRAPEGEDEDAEEFRGLFGLHGDIRIYVHTQTGVPTLIQGQIPLGMLELDVEVRLSSYRGTPATFAPIEASAPRTHRTPR